MTTEKQNIVLNTLDPGRGLMFRTGIPVLLALLLMTFFVATATAQINVAVDTTSEKASTGETMTPDIDPGLQKTVTIHSEDVNLPTVLAVLAAESGYNIVTGPGVNKEELVTIHLTDTPIVDAMDLVVRAAGLSYEIIGNSFLVASAAKLRERVGISAHVIELKYASADDILELLKDFNADITIDKGGNKLLLLTSQKVIYEIQKVVEEVDKPPLQVMLEARVIEVAVEDAEKVGIAWDRMSSYESLMIEGSILPDQAGASGGIDQFRSRADFIPFNVNDFGTIGRQEPVFDFAIDYLLSNNLAEVLVNTNIATMNNEEATVEVTDEVPYVVSAGGVGGQVNTNTVEVGYKLHIKPSVNSDGFITTTVTPEVSSVFKLIGPDQNIPWTTKRWATTKIRVKDGETIIIAGLIGYNRQYTMYKVPVLGDLPFIGGLFRHKNIQNKKTDLIIQITPHVIDEYNSGIRKSKMVEQVETHLEESEKKLEAQLLEVNSEDQENENQEAVEQMQTKTQTDDEDLELLKESIQPEE